MAYDLLTNLPNINVIKNGLAISEELDNKHCDTSFYITCTIDIDYFLLNYNTNIS